jgi:hypothetical protein
MDVPIDRSEHPGGPGVLGQPEPSFNDVDAAALARSLGARFRPFSEPLGFGRPGDQGVIEFPLGR